MTFRRRTYPEVLDGMLTSITGGVAAESQPFPPPGATAPPFRNQLQKPPVTDVVSVYGSRNGEPKLFRKDADYKLLPDQQTLEWQKGAELPDSGTLVYVNYYPKSAKPILTDIETGSVVRTLAESVAVEMASLYAQLQVVFESAFVDTASGSSLDHVVALLGIPRITGGRAAGDVEFTRAGTSRGVITIEAGTRVATADAKVTYETTQAVTMAATQDSIRVPARDLDVKNQPLPAGSLKLLPVPIAGIAGVTNPTPTARVTTDETDDELRARAKNFLHGSERATLGALKQAVAMLGMTAEIAETAPGNISITPHAAAMTPELQQRLQTSIEMVRPAGVVITFAGATPPRPLNLKLGLKTGKDLLEQDRRTIQRTLKQKLSDYFAKLSSSDNASVNRIIGLAQNIPGVEDVRILSADWNPGPGVVSVLDAQAGILNISGAPVTLGNLQIIDPGLPTLLNAVITRPQGSNLALDQTAIQDALKGAVTYLNALNSQVLAPADQPKVVLSYGRLLLAVPLPNKPAVTLQSFDTASVPPPLPTEATIAPLKARFVFSSESAASQILSTSADPPYKLGPFEQMALAGVQVSVE